SSAGRASPIKEAKSLLAGIIRKHFRKGRIMLKMKHVGLALSLSVAALPLSIVAIDRAYAAATAEDLNKGAADALQMLYRTNPVAQDLSKQARAILVFPNIVKAGLVFGGSYGEGVLRQGGRAVDYYNTASASWGLQAGAQSYGYALFLMNDKAVDYLRTSKG